MTFWIILALSLQGNAVLGVFVWQWRMRALKAEAWKETVSNKSTDQVYIKATGEPALIERKKDPSMETGGGYRTGRQRIADMMAKREFDAVTPPEVVAASHGLLSEQDKEHLNG